MKKIEWNKKQINGKDLNLRAFDKAEITSDSSMMIVLVGILLDFLKIIIIITCAMLFAFIQCFNDQFVLRTNERDLMPLVTQFPKLYVKTESIKRGEEKKKKKTPANSQ